MATLKGMDDYKRFRAALPAKIERVLRGAVRVAANVIADEARQRCVSDEVRAAIKVTVPRGTTTPGRAVALIEVKGKGAFLAPWLEYGTSPHLISVRDSARDGKSVNRLNRDVKEGSLVIGGRFVGESVQHPGARPEPFLRPAMDIKRAEALAAAQAHINSRFGIGAVATDPVDDDDS